MAQIHKTLIGVFLLFLLFILVVPNHSRAGCPTDIAPTNIGLSSHQRNFTITGTSCVLSVKWCQRTVNGTLELYIDDFTTVTWGQGCDDLLWVDIINDIRNQLILDPERGGDPPCSGTARTVVTLYTGQCLSWDVDGSDVILQFCQEAYCKKKCDVCISITGKTMENCTYESLGNAECESLFEISLLRVGDVRGGAWVGEYNTCYLLACEE